MKMISRDLPDPVCCFSVNVNNVEFSRFYPNMKYILCFFKEYYHIGWQFDKLLEEQVLIHHYIIS